MAVIARDTHAVGGGHVWSHAFGAGDSQLAYGVAVDEDDNVFITGYFSGELSFGGPTISATNGDVYLAKLNAEGEHVWTKAFVNDGGAVGLHVAAHASGAVALGGTFTGSIDFGGGQLTNAGVDSDIFVAVFDADGTHLWSDSYDGQFEQIRGFSFDEDANVIIGGTFGGSINFGGAQLTTPGNAWPYLAKFSSTGAHIFSRTGQTTNGFAGVRDLLPVDGGVVATGHFRGTLDFDGNAQVAPDGGMFLAKFDDLGVLSWFRSYQGQVSVDLEALPSDHMLFVGAISSGVDLGGGPIVPANGLELLLGEFDNLGQHVWNEHYPASGLQEVEAAVDHNGQILVAGSFYDSIDLGLGALQSASEADIFVAKFNSSGSALWNARFGGYGDQGLRDVAVDSLGNPVVVGLFTHELDFGGDAFFGLAIDIFAAKLDGGSDDDSDGWTNADDNCPNSANEDQLNADGNFVNHSPPYSMAVDDKTWPDSDAPGDACDTDDDNDGVSDIDESSGAACISIVTNPLLRDTDADRFLDGAECALGTDPTVFASKPLVTACGATTDVDGDKLTERIEVCFYGTDPANSDTDGDRTLDGARDGCEAASLNGDRIVNVADMGMLATAISNVTFRVVSVDVNKDGVWNPADQGLVASFISPSGQCPG